MHRREFNDFLSLPPSGEYALNACFAERKLRSYVIVYIILQRNDVQYHHVNFFWLSFKAKDAKKFISSSTSNYIRKMKGEVAKKWKIENAWRVARTNMEDEEQYRRYDIIRIYLRTYHDGWKQMKRNRSSQLFDLCHYCQKENSSS